MTNLKTGPPTSLHARPPARRLETEFRKRPELAPHAPAIAHHLRAERSAMTASAIEKRFITFIDWVKTQETSDAEPLRLPIEPEFTLRYAQDLHSRDITIPTIASYLWAIGSIHYALGYYAPNNHPTVKGFMTELRQKSAGLRSRRPFTLSDDEITRVLKVLPPPPQDQGRQMGNRGHRQ